MPSYWVRSRFEPADPVAAAFRFGLLVGMSSAQADDHMSRTCVFSLGTSERSWPGIA